MIIENLVLEHQLKTVCDVGGGANPVLPLRFVLENGIQYTVMDISSEELKKAPKEYEKVVHDITEKNDRYLKSFDLVITKMLAEHIKDGQALHSNIFSMLSPGGIAVHFFPTLYAFPFFINWLIPPSITSFLLNVFAPRDYYRHAKFPAYYSWCRGPSKRSLNGFKSIGYEVLEYKGLFGHDGYYQKIPPLQKLSKGVKRLLLKYPNPNFTSYALVVLRRPRFSNLE